MNNSKSFNIVLPNRFCLKNKIELAIKSFSLYGVGTKKKKFFGSRTYVFLAYVITYIIVVTSTTIKANKFYVINVTINNQ